ncbi:hypothetical protein Mgra_00008182 [Meloidogyne graminicola]|uniref:Uncharacterized protein n=1 Tax=Meloidogyne graminicola TaxID=189291 RepID=A0A8S9ZGF9_9BILA|nr:hypothetical protein Mgra_00008182 [Meloidogyne graminicola]
MDNLESNCICNSSNEDNEEPDLPIEENVENMENMNFDFEAFPPSEEDIEGLENLLAQKHIVELSNFLLQRAKKFSTSSIFRQFEIYLKINDESIEDTKFKTGFLINERLLQFPVQISTPAFTSICEQQGSEEDKNPKKKIGKAERRRLLTDASDVIFDNPEEELLFNMQQHFPYFQYPVESEVESTSRFNCIRRNGQVYRPYRRVCLLTEEQFLQFAQLVANSSF